MAEMKDQAARQVEKKAAHVALSSSGVLAGLAGGCGCVGIGLLFMGMVALFFFAGSNEEAIGDTTTTGPISSTLSSFVPPNFAAILTEAEGYTDAPAAIIGTTYLDERHLLSFGSDLASPDATDSPCDLEGPYKGPMQMGDGEWSAGVPKLKAIGIASPNICRWRDSFIAAGYLLKDGKFHRAEPQRYCKIDSSGEIILTDDCVYWWVQAYCYGGPNGCSTTSCSNSTWSYCEMAVKLFHLITGA